MPTTLLFKVHVPSLDGNLDGFTNGFVFSTPAASAPYSGLTPVITHITNFYNSLATGATNALYKYLSTSLDWNTNHSTVTVYDITANLSGAPHGSPVAMTNWTLTPAPSGTPYAEGVCACLDYQRAYGTDVEFGPAGSAITTPPDIVADYGAAATHLGKTRPRSRDRGRWYIGPLNSTAVGYDATTYRVKFQTTFINDLLKAAAALSADVSDGSGNSYVLQQWSRKNASIGLVTEFWTDDRPDYQRRRSDATPGTRTYIASAAV